MKNPIKEQQQRLYLLQEPRCIFKAIATTFSDLQKQVTKEIKKNAKLLFTLYSSQGVKKTKSVMPKNDLEKVAKFCT